MISRHYELEGFFETLDDWTRHEKPMATMPILILEWLMGVAENPYKGARREPGFPNLYTALVPGTTFNSRAVICSYWIFESTFTVRCDNLALLSLPV